jgi:hypothetical protein
MKDFIEKIDHDKNFRKKIRIIHPIDLPNERKNKKFVLFENYIIDVEKYMQYHPGGQMAIEDYLYVDNGRFLIGNQAYNKHFKSYDHNYLTLRHTIKSMAYAKLKDNHRLVSKVMQVQTTSRLNNDFSNNSDLDSTYINELNPILLHKSLVAEDTFEYRFKFKNYEFARFLSEVNWIGRHFSVSSTHLNRTRYYTVCLTLDPKIKEKHLRLIENITRLENGDLIESLLLNDNERLSDYLSLYIRIYHYPKALSNHINNLPVGNQTDLIIRGPIVRITHKNN